jgi:solute:Na+ symporter, SSS family
VTTLAVNWSALSVFLVVGAVVVGVGLLAGRWRRARLDTLDEWGLAGRRFGTLVTWFLVGGDLYTAYTFIAVPALVFGKGAIGLFAVPYTIIVYPIVLVTMPRLWQIAKNRGYVTGSDFVRDRFDSRFLALLVAITGVVATMPYIALQMLGIAVVLSQMGIPVEASLVIAFAILAAFTYVSGLRAPALLAILKDAVIWITVLVAVIYIPIHLGGFDDIFGKVPRSLSTLPSASYASYATLALGSALALFLYPHALTAVFASQTQRAVKRNAALLPAYSFLLGLIALLGYMAIAAGIKPSDTYGANSAIPDLLRTEFAFAAIMVGALVPASIMSIAAANLFSRNIWKEYIRPQSSAREEANISRLVSVLVKIGALLYIVLQPSGTDAINFQLAGGVWIVQTLPAVLIALFIPWLNRVAVIAGWCVGIGWGTWMLAQESFEASTHEIFGLGTSGTWYIGLAAVLANVLVVFAGTGIAYLAGWRPPASRIPEAQFEEPLGYPSTDPLAYEPEASAPRR